MGLTALTGEVGSARAQAIEIGEITLAIGSASIDRNGQAMPAVRGGKVQVGDIVKTPAGGHVHVKFIDGALVSVRPDSRLQIEAYTYIVERPSESTVRFTLEAGSARAISGKAAEAAKERFRLNTPFVAIGVRGTDFVTHVDRGRVSAVVNQGAIIFTPLDSACRADGTGPCTGERARLITADMRSFIEFSTGSAAPILRSLEALRGKEGVVPETPEESSAILRRGRTSVDTPALAVSDYAGQSNLPEVAKPLMWGRWTGMAVYGDVEILSTIEAHRGRVPVAGASNFSLFRYEPAPLRFDATSGTHNFRLERSSANFVPLGSAEPQFARATDGKLTINFGTGGFGALLDLESANGTRARILGIGRVDDRGIFFMDSPDTRLRGAVSRNAIGAGMVFERELQGVGTFNGVTLWGK